jgi:hypothetical protein
VRSSGCQTTPIENPLKSIGGFKLAKRFRFGIARRHRAGRRHVSFLDKANSQKTAYTSLVRLLIIRRSSSATMAMIPTVNRLAFGVSAQTKSTPAFSSPAESEHRARADPALQ